MSTPEPYETDRIDALTDGIFAVIMTLLVLELKAPEIEGGVEGLAYFTALSEVMLDVELWFVSFAVLAVLWVAHHSYLRGLKLTGVGLGLMIGFLGCVSLTPFTVELVGAHERHQGAMMVFSGVIGLAGLLLMATYVHGARLVGEVDRGVLTRLAMLPAGAAIAGGLAAVHHRTSLWIFAVVSVLSLLPERRQ